MSESANGVSLPLGWTQVRVDEAGEVRLGRQRSPEQDSGEHMTPYVRAANITPTGIDVTDLLEMNFMPDERRVYELKSGDVLLTEASGSASQVGRAAIWQGEVEPCCFQNTVIRFRPHVATSEFALLVFRYYASIGTFAEVARGVGIQHLGGSRFASIPFPLPPLAEQKRITDIADQRLREIREADASLISALDNLAEQVREILAAAITGDLTAARQREKRRVTSNTFSKPGQMNLFEDSVAATDVPQLSFALPDGWAWGRVDQLGDVTLGRQRSPKHEVGSDMRPYLRVANVYEDRIDTADVLRMNFTPDEVKTYELRAGDVLLNEGQSPELVGRPAIYRDEVPGACFQNTLVRFRPSEAIDSEYALIVFRHYLHAGVFRHIARWSTNIAHLGLERFRALPFPVPPLGEQREIAREARRRLDDNTLQRSAIETSRARLPALERELLTAAVAGELSPQNPDDEPSGSLLKRLGSPPKLSPVFNIEGSTKKMAPRRPRTSKQSQPQPDLTQVLKDSGGILALPDLFAQAGYDRDIPEHVELFYLALRETLGKTIRLTGDKLENAELEVANAA